MSKFRALWLRFPIAKADAEKFRAGCHSVHSILINQSVEHPRSQSLRAGSEFFSSRHFNASATTSWRQLETGPAIRLFPHASVGRGHIEDEDSRYGRHTALHTASNVIQNRHLNCRKIVDASHCPHPHLYHPLATTSKNAASRSRWRILRNTFSSSAPESASLQPLLHPASDTKGTPDSSNSAISPSHLLFMQKEQCRTQHFDFKILSELPTFQSLPSQKQVTEIRFK